MEHEEGRDMKLRWLSAPPETPQSIAVDPKQSAGKMNLDLIMDAWCLRKPTNTKRVSGGELGGKMQSQGQPQW